MQIQFAGALLTLYLCLESYQGSLHEPFAPVLDYLPFHALFSHMSRSIPIRLFVMLDLTHFVSESHSLITSYEFDM